MRLSPSNLLLCLTISLSARAADSRPFPNILLVTADDLGCQVSCYGETRFRTPKLDALATEGVRFDRFYVAQSSCSSSRASLLTGRWPHQSGQVGLAHLGFRMDAGQKNLPALLKGAGYHTGIIGKLHVEPSADFPWDWMPAKEKTSAPVTRSVGWVAQQSREFFGSAKTSGKPFFYYVNFFDPHGPYTPDVDQVDGVPEKPFRPADIQEPFPLKAPTEAAKKRLTATIINTILRLDVGMGLLMDELKSAGLAENTLVIFIGDNGLPVVRGKGTSYEDGVRVPLLVRWPGMAKSGRVCREMVSEVDLMPTILQAAGVAVPTELVGQSIQPLLQGRSQQWRAVLFTEMNFHTPDVFRPQRTARDDRYKLLLNLAPSEDQAAVELFDLRADPGETKNLADDAAHAAARQRLEAAITTWRQKTGDPLLDPTRVQRWKDAAARWAKLPRAKDHANSVVRIPEGDLDLLK
ncbi:MAG TPA: sulfatase [Verrucomicrobiae bacterium]|nr:sulfatase [Verrucomicrobiae bacterium]